MLSVAYLLAWKFAMYFWCDFSEIIVASDYYSYMRECFPVLSLSEIEYERWGVTNYRNVRLSLLSIMLPMVLASSVVAPFVVRAAGSELAMESVFLMRGREAEKFVLLPMLWLFLMFFSFVGISPDYGVYRISFWSDNIGSTAAFFVAVCYINLACFDFWAMFFRNGGGVRGGGDV